jgi:hypothetical protein
MLEMILNKNPSRLTERVSKFITYQVIKMSEKFSYFKYRFSFARDRPSVHENWECDVHG